MEEDNCYDCAINNHFKLPIDFLDEKHVNNISEITKKDLELIEINESNNEKNQQSFYENVFNPTSECSKETLKLWSNKYTNNKQYLKNTQDYFRKISNNKPKPILNTDDIYNKWKSFVNEDNFYEKYNFIDYNYCKFLNKNPYFMAFFSIMSILAPIISLCSPFFVVIVPFFILKYYGVDVSLSDYYYNIVDILKNTLFYQLFNNFSSIPLEKKIYMLGSIALYFYQVYINVLTCVRHHENLSIIHDFISCLKEYLNNTKHNISIVMKNVNKFKTYNNFYRFLSKKNNSIIDILSKIENIECYQWNVQEIQCMGSLMSNFYNLRYDINIHETMMFSFGFNGYVENIVNVTRYIDIKKINKAVFKNKQKLIMKNMYYPLIKENVVKNNINLKKNKIITGPNASGKTTILKTTILNILLTQQIGYGFYDNCKIQCFDDIYCYLNIPDTSGRDSLFQAEARRCKEILTNIDENKNKNHFCIFDELYSGTNPYEATASSYSFLKYLSSNNNVSFLLTTHFVDLCEKLDKHKKILNCHMKTNEVNNELQYKYRLTKGISKIRGGVEVLKKLNYPENMIKETLDYLHNL